MKKMSIVDKDYHSDEHVVGYYNAGDRMKYWGKQGAFWGGIWGMLFGAAFFVIPGLGPILVAGPLVAWIIGALEGAVVVGGLSALGAGLYSIGIPKDRPRPGISCTRRTRRRWQSMGRSPSSLGLAPDNCSRYVRTSDRMRRGLFHGLSGFAQHQQTRAARQIARNRPYEQKFSRKTNV
jgi:hypothetical protein